MLPLLIHKSNFKHMSILFTENKQLDKTLKAKL